MFQNVTINLKEHRPADSFERSKDVADYGNVNNAAGRAIGL